MYTEHVNHLLNLLDLSTQSGILSLAPTEETHAGPWRAIGELVDGKVTACKVYRTSDGRVIIGGPPALDWLKAQGGMYWQLEEATTQQTRQTQGSSRTPLTGASPATLSQARGSRPAPFSQGTQAKPRRTLLGQQSVALSSWTRLHRQVYALVDGERSSAEIARLLSNKPFREVEEALDALRESGFIE